MNEDEWLNSNDCVRKLRLLYHHTDRQLRLFACACARFRWKDMDDQQRNIIAIAEAYADASVEQSAVEEARRTVIERDDLQELAPLLREDPFGRSIRQLFTRQFPSVTSEVVRARHGDILRDIFGNPFRPVALDPRWLTSNVVDLARIIYEERAFDRLPILADALMDTGCDSDDIIQHCRQPGEHVRGCWVVDLLLGKS